jgi:FAD/FMN-containing dehydrogenase
VVAVTTWSRRGLLAAGALGTLAACSSDGSAPGRPASTAPPTASPSPTTPTSTSGKIPWAQLRRSVTGSLARPGDPAYDRVRLLPNPRYDGERPLAVLSVGSEQDVATGLAFARDHGLPVALRSGGHGYPGWSGGGSPRALVLDCRALDAVRIDGTTATIGAGADLAHVYAEIGSRGRAIAAGSCPTVGITGLALGGGVGVLTRAMGLTCDAVTGLRMVTADGTLRSVSAEEEPDLFWASRGGGGGHLGVVTSLDLATEAAPTLTTVYLAWPFAAAAEVVAAWQQWAPAADERLWSTLKALGGEDHPGEPTLLLSGTWTGPGGSLDAQLAGLLDHVPAPSVRSVHTRGYLDAMQAFAGSGAREAFAATSHVMYEELDDAGITDLLDRVSAAQESGLKEAGVSLDALGGRAGEPAPGDTAFPHRSALATVQYTATFPPGSARGADDYVHVFREAMLPHWGNHAYVNYADPTIEDYRTAYFGDNAGRLAEVRAAYDPEGFFTQPQDF